MNQLTVEIGTFEFSLRNLEYTFCLNVCIIQTGCVTIGMVAAIWTPFTMTGTVAAAAADDDTEVLMTELTAAVGLVVTVCI